MLFSFTATVTYEKLNYKLSLIKTNFFTLNFYRQREPCVYIGVVMGNFALTLVLTLLYLDIIEGSTGELNFWIPFVRSLGVVFTVHHISVRSGAPCTWSYLQFLLR